MAKNNLVIYTENLLPGALAKIPCKKVGIQDDRDFKTY